MNKALEAWAAESFEDSVTWANRAEALRREGAEDLSFIAESVSIMLRCFSNAARLASK